MTDSVTPASPSESTESTPKPAGNVLDKFTAWRAAHPDAIDAQYVLESELEAASVLLALCAVLRSALKEIHGDELGRQKMRALANAYQVAVRQGRAMDVFGKSIEIKQYIEIAGIKILPRFTVKH